MLNVAEHVLHYPHAQRMRLRRGRRLKPIRASKAAEIWYRNRMTDLVTRCAGIMRVELAKSPEVRQLMDAPFGKELGILRMLFGKVQVEAGSLAKAFSRKALYNVDDRIAKEIQRSIKLDVRPILSDHGKVMDRFREMSDWNVRLIQSVPERMLDELEERLAEAWASGERIKGIDEIVDSVVNDADVNTQRIARDQTNKMNAAFNQVRQEELGIEYYIWRCSKDERTRGNPGGLYPDAVSDHWKLDGLTFRWDEPGPATGTIDGEPCHPGQDIQCRCDAVPVINLDAMEAEASSAEEEAA